MLRISSLGPHDRVRVPIGASHDLERAALATGAQMDPVDLDPSGGAPIWPTDLVPPRPGRVVCVLDHPWGRPAPRPQAAAECVWLEDATGAVGGSARGRAVGSLGRVAVAALGAWPLDRSRGALVATDLPDQAARLQALLDEIPRDHAMTGSGGGLEADAADLEDRVDACRAAAGVYDSAFRPLALLMSVVPPHPETSATFPLYLVQPPDPDALIDALAQRDIEARRLLDPRLSSLLNVGRGTAWPGARSFYSRTVGLPCHPDLGLGELLYVADAVRRHLQGLPARS